MEKERRRAPLKRFCLAFFASVLALGATFVFLFRPYTVGDPPRIPNGWGAGFTTQFSGEPATPDLIDIPPPPRNPYLADTNASNMHVDAFASDAHPKGGPLGVDPTVLSYSHGLLGGECASVTFDSRENIVAVCATFKDFALVLLDPQELRPLAKYLLPPRASNRTMNLRKIMSDTSGGAYFFLDHEDQAVLVDSNQKLKIIGQLWQGDTVSFVLQREYDLLPTLAANTSTADVITAVLPDWFGRYWFVSRGGLIGVVDRTSNDISTLRLDGEEIQNSFAVDKEGVYVVTDHALYALKMDNQRKQPIIAWREEYETATTDKPGVLTRGSGTTPTLLGQHYVAITDNADPQINVLVYRRDLNFQGIRLIAKTPIFAPGESATENTMIGVGHSLIVENNYGYDLFPTMMFGRTGAGGVIRLDFSEATGEATVVWYNPIISQTTVPKLSLANGLIYVYAKSPSIGWGVDAYYLAALDFDTGETIFQVNTGNGVAYDNNWAPITLGPDRSAYIGVLRGLVKVIDSE